MISEKRRRVHAGLGALLGNVGEKNDEVVRLCRDNLLALADRAEALENSLLPPENAPLSEASVNSAICKCERPPLAHELGGRHG